MYKEKRFNKKNKKITKSVDTVRENINNYYDEKKKHFITNKEINDEIDKILDKDIPNIDNYNKTNSESLFRDKYKPYSVLAFTSTLIILLLVAGILAVLMINS